MSLRIIGVVDKGEDSEHLVLEVIRPRNLGTFALYDNTYDGEFVSSEFEHFFPFPDIDVEADDLIRVFSASGEYEIQYDEENERNIHNIFWGTDEPIWNKGSDKAYVIRIGRISARLV